MKFSYQPLATKSLIYSPRVISVNLNFNNNVTPRKPTKFAQIVEFAGLSCEMSRNKDLYIDEEHQYNIEFL